MLSPRNKRSSSWSTRAASLCSCSDSSGTARPRWRNSRAVCRVSSAAISATSPNNLAALGLKSSRFPIGVATTYTIPGSSLDMAAPQEAVGLSRVLLNIGYRKVALNLTGPADKEKCMLTIPRGLLATALLGLLVAGCTPPGIIDRAPDDDPAQLLEQARQQEPVQAAITRLEAADILARQGERTQALEVLRTFEIGRAHV